MKLIKSLPLLLLLSVNSTLSQAEESASVDNEQRKIHHVVIVWLKQHGDAAARRKYIEGTQHLAKLPGVLTYHIGTPADVKRNKPSHSLDDSYDIAIASTFENRQALENYLNHPDHDRVIQEVLKPLVAKYKAYDFVE